MHICYWMKESLNSVGLHHVQKCHTHDAIPSFLLLLLSWLFECFLSCQTVLYFSSSCFGLPSPNPPAFTENPGLFPPWVSFPVLTTAFPPLGCVQEQGAARGCCCSAFFPGGGLEGARPGGEGHAVPKASSHTPVRCSLNHLRVSALITALWVFISCFQGAPYVENEAELQHDLKVVLGIREVGCGHYRQHCLPRIRVLKG